MRSFNKAPLCTAWGSDGGVHVHGDLGAGGQVAVLVAARWQVTRQTPPNVYGSPAGPGRQGKLQNPGMGADEGNAPCALYGVTLPQAGP